MPSSNALNMKTQHINFACLHIQNCQILFSTFVSTKKFDSEKIPFEFYHIIEKLDIDTNSLNI